FRLFTEAHRDIDLDSGRDGPGTGTAHGTKANVEAPKSGAIVCESIVCGAPLQSNTRAVLSAFSGPGRTVTRPRWGHATSTMRQSWVSARSAFEPQCGFARQQSELRWSWSSSALTLFPRAILAVLSAK